MALPSSSLGLEDGNAESSQLSCFMELLMLFLPLHLVNCVRFSRFSQLPIEYETRDGMEKTSCNGMQLRSLETFAVFQRSKCRFKVAYTSA